MIYLNSSTDFIKNIEESFLNIINSQVKDDQMLLYIKLFYEKLIYLKHYPFVYSLLAGVSISSSDFLSKFLLHYNSDYAKEHILLFIEFLNTGTLILQLSNDIEALDESFTFWLSIFRSPIKSFYYQCACPICLIKRNVLWFQQTSARISFNLKIYQKRNHILLQTAQLINLPWKKAFEGDRDSCSAILSLKKCAINNISHFHKPNMLIRTWPLVLSSIISFICIGKMVANIDLNWWIYLYREWKETMVQFSTQWIFNPIKEIISTMKYKSRKFGIESSLASDAESLRRMIAEYVSEKKYIINDEHESLELVYKDYEKTLISPIRHPVDLIRLGLIQAQKTRVDASAALEALDHLLKANELNFALIAAIPSIIILYGIYKWTMSIILDTSKREAGDIKTAKEKMRRFLREIQNSLGKNDLECKGKVAISAIFFRKNAFSVYHASEEINWIEEDLLFILDETIGLSARCLAAERLWRFI